ncbi:MAG: winged helix-turn-helix transcriptional regulator [Desulfurococcaceae archaeon]
MLKRTLISILTMIVLITYLPIIDSNALNGIDRVNYIVIYDPEDGVGMAILKIYVSQISDYEEISLPINIFISESADYDFLYYTSTPGLDVLPSYDKDTGIISFIVRGSGNAEFVFSIRDLMEEAGIGIYILFINSSIYKDIVPSHMFSMEIHILGKYNIFIREMITENASYSIAGNSTMSSVFINGTGTFILVSSLELPLENTVSAISPLTTPNVTTSIVSTTSPFQYTTPTSGVIPGMFSTIIVLIVLGTAVILVLALFLARRGKYAPEIETGDITTDPVAKSIIKILGESGQTELLQSEIVNKTKLPKSSVSRRIRRLEEDGYIMVRRAGKYNYISLTTKGWGLYRKLFGDKKS